MSYSVGKKKEMKELRRSGSDDVQVVELGKYSNTLHFTSIHFCFSISFLKLFWMIPQGMGVKFNDTCLKFIHVFQDKTQIS
jgi:hypothetical protein